MKQACEEPQERRREWLSAAVSLYLRAVDSWIPRFVRDDPETRRRARIVVSFTYILLILGCETLVFFYWSLPSNASAWVAASLVAGMLLTLGIPAALRRGRIVLASNLLLTASYGVILTAFVLLGGMQAPLLHWCALLPMLSLLMGTRRSAWGWAAVSMLTIGALAAVGFVGVDLPNHLELNGRAQYVQRFVDVVSWVGILFAVAALYERHESDRSDALGSKNAELQREIASRHIAEERTRFLAYHDELTKLPNREFFKDQLRASIERAADNDRMVAVLFLDLDGFKEVNDTYGHGQGDRLLQEVSLRLGNCVRAADAISRGRDDGAGGMVSRLGGDEFTVLLSTIRGPEEAALVARRILAALEPPIALEEKSVSISASIGISIYPRDVDDLDGLLRNADLAMYHAKDRGKNNYQFYDEGLNRAAQRRASLASALRLALDEGQLSLHYQPIYATSTGDVVALEALLRWRHPDRGLLLPGEFIEVAEDTGLVVPIGSWVLREACRQWRSWRDAGLPELRLAVNVSGVQFRETDLASMVAGLLEEFAIPSKSLEIEITENAMMEDEEEVSRALRELKSLGVRISLDDFGTGYSSLSYVKRFPVDAIKIDRTFVQEVVEDAEARAITSAVISLSHELSLTVIAEGVESEAQERFLVALGCDELQGFRYSRPLPAAEVPARVAEAGGGVLPTSGAASSGR